LISRLGNALRDIGFHKLQSVIEAARVEFEFKRAGHGQDVIRAELL